MAIRSAEYLVVAVFASWACSPDVSDQQPLPPAPPAKAEAPISLDTLLVWLRGPSPEARLQAARALAEPGPRIEERVRALRGALTDPRKDVGMAAARSLGKIGVAALPTLMQALADSRAFVRERAVYGLAAALHAGNVGPQATSLREAIRSATYDPDPTVRRAGRRGMSVAFPRPTYGGGPDLGSIEDLQAGLAASDPRERLSAVRRFHPYSDDPDESVRLLLRGLGDADPRVRGAAADALLALGPPARAALTAALSDSSPVVRREASVALVRLGVLR